MTSEEISQSIIKTLQHYDSLGWILTDHELFNFMKLDSPLKFTGFQLMTRNLVAQGLIKETFEDSTSIKYLELPEADHQSKIDIRDKFFKAYRKKLAEISEKAIKLKAKKHIKFIATINPLFLKRSENIQANLLIIVEDEFLEFTKFFCKNFLGLKKDMQNLLFVKSSNFDVLLKKEVVKIISISPIYCNNGFFENYLSKNLGLFRNYPNFPLEKIAYGIKGSKGAEAIVKTPLYIKIFNRFIGAQ